MSTIQANEIQPGEFFRSKGHEARKSTTKWLCLAASLIIGLSHAAQTATFEVGVQEGDEFVPHFVPMFVDVHVGDTVTWVWNDGFSHSVVSGIAGTPDGVFDSGVHTRPHTFSVTFTEVGRFQYYCGVHFRSNPSNIFPAITVAAPTPTPTPTPTPDPNVDAQPLNISTRMEVRQNDQVLIGGFIITGSAPKEVVLRAIGPSLADFGIANALPDPVLELRAFDGSLITMNDNWKDSQQAEIEAIGFEPQSDLESAILATLDPGNYTAIVSGKNGATGVGLVEGYDLETTADSQLANISTRGFIETGSNVMIGGFILGGGGGDASIVIRAIGPSLSPGVPGALADPTLELRDENAALVQSNDNWKDSQQLEIEQTGLQPSLDLESAILSTLGPGAYTAIVAGQGNTTGVGLVEVYRLP